ncbi:hypothetical protein [Streptomyces sp. NPDC047061]|uniref:hypothetical protein n=1 Tax=Streptomyces sp. NPDC047061 TaxID=3154605 RepID=UPI0033CAE93D
MIPVGKFRVDVLMRMVPRRGWQQLSAGAGAKGPRYGVVDTRPAPAATADARSQHEDLQLQMED